MNNSQIYIGAIVLGVIALILGALFLTNILGTHHSLPYYAFGAGAVLIIVGIIGMVVVRNRA